MTHNGLQPTTSVSQRFPQYGAQWEGYDLHQGGYGESQMFRQQQFPGDGPSSPGAPRVPPGPPGNTPVNRPSSSSSNPPPGPPSGSPQSIPISLPTKRFLPPAQLQSTEVARILDLPSLPDIAYDNCDADDESDDSLNLGGAEGKHTVSLMKTEFSLKQFAKCTGQANDRVFNKCITVWVAVFLEKKRRSIIRRQNHLRPLRDGPLH